MSANALLIPIVLPLVCAGVAVLLKERVRALGAVLWVAVLGCLGFGIWGLGLPAELMLAVGGWDLPRGIVLWLDPLSALMLTMTAGVGAIALGHARWFAPDGLKTLRVAVLSLLFFAGANGAFLTNDIFNLFVWFELLLIAGVGLIAALGDKAALRGALKFLVLNWVVSLLFLFGAALLYQTSGNLSLSLLRESFGEGDTGIRIAGAIVVGVFLVKAAAFPVFGWLPPAYGAVPVTIGALMAGVSTKVGIYALIRVSDWAVVRELSWLLHGVAILTMLVGVLGALAQTEVRRTLSWHIISQIGYMVFGVAVGGPLGIAGAVLHLLHNAFVKMGLFLWCDHAIRGAGSAEFGAIGGLSRRLKVAGFAYTVLALALVGVPPLSGFFSKLVLIRAGVSEYPSLWIVAVPVVTGMLTLTCLMKIDALLRTAPTPAAAGSEERSERVDGSYWPLYATVGLAVAIGLGAGPLVDLALGVGQ